MRPKKGLIIAVLLAIGFCTQGNAQWQGEVNLLRSFNSRYPTNSYLKLFTASAYPVSIAVPFSILAISLINDSKKDELNAYEMGASIAISAAITEGLKIIVNRQRPYEKYGDIYPDVIENGQSFPSGHTSIAFSTAASLTIFYKKWYVAIPAYTWAASVGYSRMYLGQHYPSDVLAGAIVGVGSAYAAHWLNKKLFHKK